MSTQGRVYTVPIVAVASPAAIFDLFELVPATGKPIQILRLLLDQISEPSTEEERLTISVMLGHTTSGSGGSTPTPSKKQRNDTAAGFTAETMNTTVATGGTPETPEQYVWNTRAGLDLPFSPEESQGSTTERIVLRCSAPADAITVTGTLWVEEFG